MTDEDRLLLSQLRTNMNLLFQGFNKIEAENRILLGKVSDLKNEIASNEQKRAELSRENEKLRLANKILAKSDENQEAKKRINKIVREIDKCIALLNK
jgi:regulator of replication initiation timing